MDNHFQFTISQQSDYYNDEQLVSIFVNQSYSLTQEYFASLKDGQVQNKCQDFDGCKSESQSLSDEQSNWTNQCSFRDNPLFESLRNRIMFYYVEHVSRCKKMLSNVEFESQCPEMDGKREINAEGMLSIFIQASEILNYTQIKRFNHLLETFKKCQFLIAELICNVANNLRDELLMCVYCILEQLWQVRQERREQNILNNVLLISNEISLRISNEVCIVHLTFQLYNDHCEELRSYFHTFLCSMVELIFNAELNKNLENVVNGFQELQVGRETVGEFSFDFQENQEYNDVSKVGVPWKSQKTSL